MAANIDIRGSSTDAQDEIIASLPSEVEKFRLLPPGPDDPVGVSFDNIFVLEAVRDTILVYAIQNKTGLCHKTINNLRLVNKTWNTSVINVVRKTGLPMYRLVLSSNTEIIEKADSFLNLVSARISQQNAPTFSLKIFPNFFAQENYNRLLNYLVLLGTGLISLVVEMPSSGGSLPCVFPNLSLRILRSFRFKITGNRRIKLTYSLNFTAFIQSIFNGSYSLKQFTFENNGSHHPLGIRCLMLSKTIKFLEFILPINLKETDSPLLQILDSSEPKILEKLVLQIPLSSCDFYDDGLFRVLDRFKTSLRDLTLRDRYTKNSLEINRTPNIKFFPLMQKLESFSIESQYLEQKDDCPSKYFPNINNLCLFNQVHSGLKQWLGNSVYENIVSIFIGSDSTTQSDETNKLTLNTIQMVGKACPNLRILYVWFFEFEESSIRYVFREMRKLRVLSIKLTGFSINSSQDFWDAVLIGCSPEVASALRANLEFSQHLQIGDSRTPSLRNMQDLNPLQLLSLQENPPLISDLLFHICLLKMTNLNTLTLEGGFKASDEMTDKWRSLN